MKNKDFTTVTGSFKTKSVLLFGVRLWRLFFWKLYLNVFPGLNPLATLVFQAGHAVICIWQIKSKTFLICKFFFFMKGELVNWLRWRLKLHQVVFFTIIYYDLSMWLLYIQSDLKFLRRSSYKLNKNYFVLRNSISGVLAESKTRIIKTTGEWNKTVLRWSCPIRFPSNCNTAKMIDFQNIFKQKSRITFIVIKSGLYFILIWMRYKPLTISKTSFEEVA